MLILFEWLVTRFFISINSILHSSLNDDRISKDDINLTALKVCLLKKKKAAHWLSPSSLGLPPRYLGYSSSVQFSRSVMSDSLLPHGLQHARPPCPSPTPGVYPNSCLLSRWCHPTIYSSVIPFFSHLQSFSASGSFQRVFSVFRIRWPKYWSFSFNISPSSEHSGLISFRMD